MRRTARALAAVCLLALLLVGVPLATWRAAGWPLPAEIPGWDDIGRRIRQGDIDGSIVVRSIAVVVWLAWMQLAWALVWEVVVNVRRDVAGRPTRSAPLVLAPIGNGVAHLVAAALAIGTLAQPSPAFSLSALPAPATIAPALAALEEHPEIQWTTTGRVPGDLGEADTPVWVADRYDSLWTIAERTLGDGGSVDEVLTLNPTLTATHTFRDGETVLLPARASVPAERRVDRAERLESPTDLSAYEVQVGDGMWDVALALLGDGARYPELIERVTGQEVAPGVVYRSASQVIQPGWVFRLPTVPDAEGEVVVRRGDSLWSIAEDHLGDPARWTELWEANRLETMDDGRVFDDPDLIHPGWTLELPVTAESAADIEVATAGSPPDRVGEPNETGPSDVPGNDGRPPTSSDALTDPDPRTVEPVEPEVDVSSSDRVSRSDRVNVWDPGDAPVEPSDSTTGAASAEPGLPDAGPSEGSDAPVSLLTFDRAAMLSAGLLLLLGVRRRDRLRRSPPRGSFPERAPRAVATERTLRAVSAGERFARVDIAIRAAAMALVEAGERVLAVTVAPDGQVTVIASGAVELPLPWNGSEAVWTLPSITPLELLAPEAQRSGAPCPALVQLGSACDGRDVYVDLEAIEALEIAGPVDAADAIVNAIATSLASSVMAEVTSLVTVGVPEPALLDHRHHQVAHDVEYGFELAAEAVGSTRSQHRSTFELRALGTSGEAWEPAVVLIGSSVGTTRPPADRRALAVVSASPIEGPASRLSPIGTSSEWELTSVGLTFTPIGLSASDIAELAEFARMPEAIEDRQAADATDTGVGDPARRCAEAADPEWAVLVTTLGKVSVIDTDGRAATFERSKTKELIVWLVTHRLRSTRSSARAALWEMDVRDATFANVVSEARRSLARLVEPPEGAEWIDRTLTDELPLHERVWSDGDVIEAALEVARLQPPMQAIATLRPAVDLINGMPFAGTGYLWPDAEGITSRLVLLATTATAELAAHCLSVGDVDGVFSATARGLQVLPGHEELVGLRMRAHAKAGDHAGVRAEWESYERVLVGDPWSDGEPSPKLVDLRRSLLGGSKVRG